MSYSSRYIEHFSNPRGVGDINQVDGWSEVQHEGEGCFDRVKFQLRIQDDVIMEVKFRARACSGTIAACSAMTEIAAGKSIGEAEQLTPTSVIDYLGGMPERKFHSAQLAVRALQEAITRYRDGRQSSDRSQ